MYVCKRWRSVVYNKCLGNPYHGVVDNVRLQCFAKRASCCRLLVGHRLKIASLHQ